MYSVATGPFGEVTADRRIEFRWVESDAGWVFLQRWWLTEPSTGTKLDLGSRTSTTSASPPTNGAPFAHASWLKMQMSTGDATERAPWPIRNWEKDADGFDAWIDENL